MIKRKCADPTPAAADLAIEDAFDNLSVGVRDDCVARRSYHVSITKNGVQEFFRGG